MIENISLPPSTPSPSHTLQPTLFSSIRQAINTLTQPSPVTRKQSIKTLHTLITTSQISPSAIQQLSRQFLKNILVSFTDHSDEVREYSVRIVIELLIRAEEVDQMLPYIVAVLVERLGCRDLEGVKGLPEAMRPPPNQKPHVVIKLVETSEEVRMMMCKLVEKIIGLVDINVMRRYLDDMINILRALVMDPYSEIQFSACHILSNFCLNFKNILLNYTETMGRSILLPLVSKKSKIRIAALTTLNSILLCGIWKFNAFIFQNLIGFKDPNSVAIKQFYEPSLNINYLGFLVTDTNLKVKEVFFDCLEFWVCRLDDKYDHHPKLVPYVLSGLFDGEKSIRQKSMRILEEIGGQIEKEKHAEFKQNIQYGIDSEWTWQNKLKDAILLPPPFHQRPRLGSRFFIKGHISKMWPALYREIRDINIEHRKKAVNLALMGVIYTESYMTSHLNKFIPNFITSLKIHSPEDIEIARKVEEIFYYLGIFCPYSSYIHIIKSGIVGEIVQNEEFIQSSFCALNKLMEGNLHAIPEGTGLCHKKKDISQLLNMITEVELYNEITGQNAKAVELLVVNLIKGITGKATERERKELFSVHFVDLLKLFSISFYEQELGGGLMGYAAGGKGEVKVLELREEIGKSWEVVRGYVEGEGFDGVKEELEGMFVNPPSLNESGFKFIVGLFVNLTARGGDKDQPEPNENNVTSHKSEQILSLLLDLILEIIYLNRLPQLLDFFLKLIQSTLLSTTFSPTHTPLLIKILISTLSNFSTFKSYKKVPIYQQHQQPQTLHTYQPRISQQYASTIFKHIISIFQSFQYKKVSFNDNIETLSSLISSYLSTVQSFRRIKDLSEHSIRPIWSLIERLDKSSLQLHIRLFKHQNQFVLPQLIDYLIQRVETLKSDSQMYYLSIVSLSKLLEVFPKGEGKGKEGKEMEMYCVDFGELVGKLVRYCLDEKDLEAKGKLKGMLKGLAGKMRAWFEGERKRAESGHMHERGKLLEEILQ